MAFGANGEKSFLDDHDRGAGDTRVQAKAADDRSGSAARVLW